MVDHCIAVFSKKQEERLFRTYLTDALMAIVNNTSKQSVSKIEKRYADIAGYTKPAVEKTGDEIVKDIIKRAGLRVKA